MAMVEAKKELTSANLQSVLESCSSKINYCVGVEFGDDDRRREFSESFMKFIIDNEIKDVLSMVEEDNFTAIKFKNGSFIRTITTQTEKMFNFQEILVDLNGESDIIKDTNPTKKRTRRRKTMESKNEALDDFLKTFTICK